MEDSSGSGERAVTDADNTPVCPWNGVREVTLHLHICSNLGACLGAQLVENPPAMQKTPVQSLGQADALKKGMATPQDSWPSLVAQMVKSLPAVQETLVRSLCEEDPLEKGMAVHSSVLAWRIPWTEEPGRLQSICLQTVRHD